MAKIKKNDTVETVTLQFGDFTLDFASLPPHALHYLAQYGFAKSLQDSVSGKAKEWKDALVTLEDTKNPSSPYFGIPADRCVGAKKYNESEIVTMLHDVQAKRMAAILDGTIGAGRGTPRLKGRDKLFHEVAMEQLKAVFALQRKALPKDEAWERVLGDYKTKYEKKITVEVERRMEMQAETVDLSNLGI